MKSTIPYLLLFWIIAAMPAKGADDRPEPTHVDHPSAECLSFLIGKWSTKSQNKVISEEWTAQKNGQLADADREFTCKHQEIIDGKTSEHITFTVRSRRFLPAVIARRSGREDSGVVETAGRDNIVIAFGPNDCRTILTYLKVGENSLKLQIERHKDEHTSQENLELVRDTASISAKPLTDSSIFAIKNVHTDHDNLRQKSPSR